MYSSEDLERFYFQYQTEALPHEESLQSFIQSVREEGRKVAGKAKLGNEGTSDRQQSCRAHHSKAYYSTKQFTSLR